VPTYITLARWTREGIADVKKSPGRLKKVKALAKAHGGSVKKFYLTMGRCDMVVIGEFPDDETAAKAMLTIGSGGSVTTETLRAFGEGEYRKIIAEI